MESTGSKTVYMVPTFQAKNKRSFIIKFSEDNFCELFLFTSFIQRDISKSEMALILDFEH